MSDNDLRTLTSSAAGSTDQEYTSITGTQVGDKRAADVFMQGPYAIFGDLSVIQDTPVVQVDALNGITKDHEVFSATGGSVTHKTDHGGKEFECNTGTSVGGYGLIRSKRALRYRPGQGIKFRYTARFGAPVALLAQRAGGIGVGSELSFGHNGSLGFGVLLRSQGRLEMQTLTLTVAAAGAETATITLDGIAYTAALTAGTLAHNAFEITESADFGVTQTWQAYQNGDTVLFIKSAVGVAAGAYSYASDGDSAGTLAQKEAGTAVVDTWVYQDDWDNQRLFGSGTAFDPTKGNVYQIEFGYLGYAGVRFSIMNNDSNKLELVHTIKYPNAYEVPHLDIPNFKVGWFAASLGSTTDTSMFGSSCAGLVSGPIEPMRNPVGHANDKTNVGTTLTNILSIRVRPEFAGFVNLAQVIPEYISVAVDGTKAAQVELHINAVLGGEPNWTYHEETESIVEYDAAATTVTGGSEVIAFALSKEDSRLLPLQNYNIKLERQDTLTLAVKATASTTNVSGSIGWLED